MTIQAKAIIVGRCADPDCDLIHIMLCDGDEKPVAQITPDCAEALAIAKDIRETVDGVVKQFATGTAH